MIFSCGMKVESLVVQKFMPYPALVTCFREREVPLGMSYLLVCIPELQCPYSSMTMGGKSS